MTFFGHKLEPNMWVWSVWCHFYPKDYHYLLTHVCILPNTTKGYVFCATITWSHKHIISVLFVCLFVSPRSSAKVPKSKFLKLSRKQIHNFPVIIHIIVLSYPSLSDKYHSRYQIDITLVFSFTQCFIWIQLNDSQDKEGKINQNSDNKFVNSFFFFMKLAV